MMEIVVFMGKLLFATMLYLAAIQLSIKLHNYLNKKKEERKKQNGIT